MTPRGAQDKQPLALTWRELPWAPADYKTRRQHDQAFSVECVLQGDTPTIVIAINLLTNTNKV